ncbi:hypothetical protein [Halobacterium yunchengense]|uniref:hypothetical protein n=1 Tax=Halobacterium yunchengense TaxID=3108497 RepID=UPI003009BA7B
MPELADAVIEEAAERGQRLLVDEFVALVERHHEPDGAGVPRELVEAYFAALEDERAVDVEVLRGAFEDELTDADAYDGRNAVYEVGDGRVSTYPAEWHDRLGADASLAAFVGVMTESMGDPPRSGASPGVAEDDLLDAAVTLGGRSRRAAREELEELRADGVLVEDADQHPRAGVALAADVDFEEGGLGKPDRGDAPGG